MWVKFGVWDQWLLECADIAFWHKRLQPDFSNIPISDFCILQRDEMQMSFLTWPYLNVFHGYSSVRLKKKKTLILPKKLNWSKNYCQYETNRSLLWGLGAKEQPDHQAPSFTFAETGMGVSQHKCEHQDLSWSPLWNLALSLILRELKIRNLILNSSSLDPPLLNWWCPLQL